MTSKTAARAIGLRAGRTLVLVAALASVAGCDYAFTQDSPAPFPVKRAPGLGGIYALGAIQGGPSPDGDNPVPFLIDTGTVLTTRSRAGDPGIVTEGLRIFGLPPGSAAPVPRVEFDSEPIFESQLAPVGVGSSVMSFSGILGGDLLSSYAMSLDFGAEPSVALGPAELACSCAVANACSATFPFTLAGGSNASPTPSGLQLGDSVYPYPATRVTVGACLEPVVDPVGGGVCCMGLDQHMAPFHQAGYEVDTPPGTDIRMLIATGFSGVLLSSSVWDRLRGDGASDSLTKDTALYFAGSTAPVYAARVSLGDPSPASSSDAGAATDGATPTDGAIVDGAIDLAGVGVPPARDGGTTVDGGATDGGTTASTIYHCPTPNGEVRCDLQAGPARHAALALVGNEGLLGPCGELARSRRLRAYAVEHGPYLANPTQDCRGDAYSPSCDSQDCPGADGVSCLQCVSGAICNSPNQCNDRTEAAAAVIELDGSMDVYVAADTEPVFQEVNSDIGPQLSVVEGIIGASLLTRVSTEIDYPNHRVIASCAPGSDCQVFPRYVCPQRVNDCGPGGQDALQVCRAAQSLPQDPAARCTP